MNNLAIGLAYPLAAADRERLRNELQSLLPQGRHELLPLKENEPLPSHCSIYLPCDNPPPGMGEHPALAWIQACSAGADAFVSLPNVRDGRVVLTSASGMHSVHIAEFVIAAMINLSRRMDRLWSLTQSRQWLEPRVSLAGPALRGQTVAILGYGSIGREVGRLAHVLGMKIIAICRQPGRHPDDGFHLAPEIGDPQGRLPVEWFSSEQLPAAVEGADFLVITCPLTDRTRGIVNQAVLDAMKPTAFLVNVGRGAIIEFEALRNSLSRGRIAGAALDVHPKEPLLPDDPVYDLPNAQITPHMSGVMTDEDYSRLLCDVLLENLRRFVKGEPLLNRVQP
jgi:phosphoglycerate dehydrogenase-like enzyme